MTYGSGNSGNYKKLKGQNIQVLDTDPVVFAGTWATGGDMNTARFNTASGFGTQTAGAVTGGLTPADDYTNNVEEYNGTSWSEVNNTSRDKFSSSNSTGTQTAGLLCGGYVEPASANVNSTEEYDGTNWSSGGDYPAAIAFGQLVGIQTAALMASGVLPPGLVGECNTYDGSSWTEIAEINTSRKMGTIGGGTTTDAVIGSGQNASNNVITNTETWNGTAWTEVNDMNTGRHAGSSSQNGVSTSIIAAGGNLPPNNSLVNTEIWNGTSWTETNDLSQKRGFSQGAGTGTLALAMGGNTGPGGNPAILATTEEWSFPSTPNVQEGQLWVKTATGASSVLKGYAAQGTGAWASGGNLNTGRYSSAGAGIQTAGLVFGGAAPSRTGATEEYNGSTWTESGDLAGVRNELGGAGIQTSAMAAGGRLAPAATENVELYNGSTWSETTEMNTARDSLSGFGATNTATIMVSGQPMTPAVEQWNGSSWTEIAELNANKELGASAGTVTSGITMGGVIASPAKTNQTETWDGTAWTEVGDFNTARNRLAAAGKSNGTALIYGGENASDALVSITELWNGSSWTELGDLSTARYGMGGGGGAMPALSALASGGYGGSPAAAIATTEEWTVPFVTKTLGTD